MEPCTADQTEVEDPREREHIPHLHIIEMTLSESYSWDCGQLAILLMIIQAKGQLRTPFSHREIL